MPDGGRFTITTNVGELDEEDAAALGVPPGAYAAIDFSDTGHGIPLELRSRVFEPFFTTRRDGKRAGLGLAVVRGVVRQSGGAVELVPHEGAGTTVRVWLPHVAAHSGARYSMLRKEDYYQSWRSGYEPRFP
jgi:signal transduction histidine kinase